MLLKEDYSEHLSKNLNTLNGRDRLGSCWLSKPWPWRWRWLLQPTATATATASASGRAMDTQPNDQPEGYSRFQDEHEHPQTKKWTGEDLPNQMGSQGALPQVDVEDRNDGVELRGENNLDPDLHWEMNYHEAAIFLEEGKNNDKFDSHPSNPEALPAYLLVHNQWYYGLDLTTSLVLLALGFVEPPAHPILQMSVAVHGCIELVALGILGIELALKLRWIGWRTILRHKRTMLKGITLAVMVLEAITVLARQSSHLRVTRALRPIFLVDTRHCGGVRRFIRQILQSLPPILDMMGLLLFWVCLYSLLGFFLFSQDKMHREFDSLGDSFVSMFVLLTTANFPDVMMPAFARSKWFSMFFISYLCIVLYVLMNLMLAVVYETFTRIEREKFRKLLLHKRQACQLAFGLLVSKQDPTSIRFKHFEGLIRYYAPKKSSLDTLLMFHYLDSKGAGRLTLNDFYGFYDAGLLRWRRNSINDTYPDLASWCLAGGEVAGLFARCGARLSQLAAALVLSPHFERFIYFAVLFNGCAMVTRIAQAGSNLEEAAANFAASWDTALFVSIFTAEAALKLLGLGPKRYFASGWNVYDITVTIACLVGFFTLRLFPSALFMVVLRPLRLLRLFKLNKRYRDVFGTLVLLTPLMSSTAIVMLVVYYFFAIIGMELFAGLNMRNCCVNTTVEDFYKYSLNTSTPSLGYYYLNNFDSLLEAGVTLFELTIVNNWFILMNGYVTVTAAWKRGYFILFYLTTMVVLTIVVASVLEAFRFRIQYKRQTSKREEEKMLHEEVSVQWDSLPACLEDFHLLERLRNDLIVGGTTLFLGCRPRNREVLQKRMYRTEIEEWMKEADAAERLGNILVNSESTIPVEGEETSLVTAEGYHRNHQTINS